MHPDREADEWASRDFPVLLAAARLSRRRDLSLGTSDMIAIELDITEQEASQALIALDDGQYIEAISGGAGLDGAESVLIVKLRERGRRAVGIWPSGEGADALVDALRQAEDATDDPEEKTLIRRAKGAVGSVSRDIMIDVVAAVIARQSGIG